MPKTFDIEHLLSPEHLATEVANRWSSWCRLRNSWVEERKELRNYLYATDTRTTSNNKLPWSNSTTTPKLTQIKDNLHANLFAALFPQKHWLRWEGADKDSNSKQKKQIITGYMESKLAQQSFEETASKLLDDVIDYGNAFAFVEYTEDFTSKFNGDIIENYTGPKVHRISPFDIAFDPTASSFFSTPKIIRSLVSMGEVKRMVEKDGKEEYQEVFAKMQSNRQVVHDQGDNAKGSAFVADGFSDISHYYNSGFVEILTFYGDLFDASTGTLYTDRIITVVDRSYVLSSYENPSWKGYAPIFHVGWRSRPDNLYAMGPLDNLVGMQYRIDHLENLKADVFDFVALPMLKIRGTVDDFDIQPGARIYVGDEGDVSYLHPDTTALQADFQISQLENKMEEMAGAPRQAMGIRTPGEKTAFEVQTLQNQYGRIFQHKASHLERSFFEQILNYMLAEATRNMISQELIKVDTETGAVLTEITREDIVGRGKIRSVGARHFAERALKVQNVRDLWQIKQSDPTVGVHLSGKKIAELLSEELGEPELYKENIGITEQTETQGVQMEAQVDFEEKQQVAAETGL